MRKEQLKNISTEILLERKKTTITTIRILFLVSLFGFLLFLNAYNNTKEITIIHVILAGAIVGGIIELIIKLILISREIKERKMGTPSK